MDRVRATSFDKLERDTEQKFGDEMRRGAREGHRETKAKAKGQKASGQQEMNGRMQRQGCKGAVCRGPTPCVRARARMLEERDRTHNKAKVGEREKCDPGKTRCAPSQRRAEERLEWGASAEATRSWSVHGERGGRRKSRAHLSDEGPRSERKTENRRPRDRPLGRGDDRQASERQRACTAQWGGRGSVQRGSRARARAPRSELRRQPSARSG